MILKSCKKCGELLEHLIFAPPGMFEEWEWSGDRWVILGRSSLIHDPQLEVRCPNCDTVVGIGRDFGF
ncbi:MAG: hypothetical protein LBH29_04755 [Elusimicrobiota bacterium]|jgi:phage FluMu protein Com|nr:hypothetical protein [Elusimicrobiota bacterium]